MRHWAFGALHLAPTTDARAIKRAYASLLKQHRPDDDPAGFQRLNEAYEAALDWASKNRAAPAGIGMGPPADADSAMVIAAAIPEPPVVQPERIEALLISASPAASAPEPVPVLIGEEDAPRPPPPDPLIIAESAPAPSPAPVRNAAASTPSAAPTVQAFHALLQAADTTDASLAHWLETHLLALGQRRAFGEALLGRLDADPALPAPDRMALLIEFFDWRALSRLHLERRVLARASACADVWRSANTRFAFEPDAARLRTVDRRLLHPRPSWLLLLTAAQPMIWQRMLHRIDELDLLSEGQVERVLPVGNVRFWRCLGPGKPLLRAWVQVAMLRGLGLATFMGLPGFLDRDSESSLGPVLWFALWVCTNTAAITLLSAALRSYGQRHPRRYVWIRRLRLPFFLHFAVLMVSTVILFQLFA